MSYRIVNGRAYPTWDIDSSLKNNNNSSSNIKSQSNSFKDVLEGAIKVSKHAESRLQGISFSENDMREIEKGFVLAANKGSKNAVMIYKDVAIVASIENKTLITAVEKNRAVENVFTNIDSVVIL